MLKIIISCRINIPENNICKKILINFDFGLNIIYNNERIIITIGSKLISYNANPRNGEIDNDNIMIVTINALFLTKSSI